LQIGAKTALAWHESSALAAHHRRRSEPLAQRGAIGAKFGDQPRWRPREGADPLMSNSTTATARTTVTLSITRDDLRRLRFYAHALRADLEQLGADLVDELDGLGLAIWRRWGWERRLEALELLADWVSDSAYDLDGDPGPEGGAR